MAIGTCPKCFARKRLTADGKIPLHLAPKGSPTYECPGRFHEPLEKSTPANEKE